KVFRVEKCSKLNLIMEIIMKESTIVEILPVYNPINPILGCFIAISIVIVIINIVNINKAKKYLLTCNAIDSSKTNLICNQSGFERFYLWPKCLGYLMFLSLLIGLCVSSYMGMCLSGIMKTKVEPHGGDMFFVIETALYSLICFLFLSSCLFVLYCIFRIILQIVYQRHCK
ncbi:MAG: hypothetical protein QME51_11320, partial [Planctomycetota bacterium]|nr:hypothetical protein [Planctomycetota bacterium]